MSERELEKEELLQEFKIKLRLLIDSATQGAPIEDELPALQDACATIVDILYFGFVGGFMRRILTFKNEEYG